VTTGANRNCVLLDTIGEQLLSVDDDTVCQIAVPPGGWRGIDRPTYDPTEFWFYPDSPAMLASVERRTADVLKTHELFMDQAVMTLSGRLGDSAMDSPRSYFTLTGESRARFVSSESNYRSALTSREVLRTVRQPTLSYGPFCMCTAFGLDQRAIVPPFMPVDRNADGTFGLMRQTVMNAQVAFLPWSLLHAPNPVRTYAPDCWAEAAMVRFSDIVMAAILTHRWRADAVTTADRLVDLGRHLVRLGALPFPDFDARVRITHQLRRLAFATVLEDQLKAYDSSPAFWAEDIRRMLSVLERAAADCGPIAKPESQSRIGRFGELCIAWPALVDASQRLKADGVRLSAPIGV
jgi:hypothetical protein